MTCKLELMVAPSSFKNFLKYIQFKKTRRYTRIKMTTPVSLKRTIRPEISLITEHRQQRDIKRNASAHNECYE